MSLEYYEEETLNDENVAERIKNEVGALRSQQAKEIQRELRRPMPKGNPLASPKIYKHARQYHRTNHTGYVEDRVRYHPFVPAATHLWSQLEICINWFHMYPKQIHAWIRYFIIPCERKFEFGDTTPGLYNKIMKLDIEDALVRWTKNKKYRIRNLTPRAGRCILSRITRITE